MVLWRLDVVGLVRSGVLTKRLTPPSTWLPSGSASTGWRNPEEATLNRLCWIASTFGVALLVSLCCDSEMLESQRGAHRSLLQPFTFDLHLRTGWPQFLDVTFPVKQCSSCSLTAAAGLQIVHCFHRLISEVTMSTSLSMAVVSTTGTRRYAKLFSALKITAQIFFQ